MAGQPGKQRAEKQKEEPLKMEKAKKETPMVERIEPTDSTIVLERVPDYLSIREAATVLGVSERSVYGYVEAGKLPGARIGSIIVVVAEAVYAFERRAPGRIRTRTPPWRVPPRKNLLYLTTITVRVRPGQSEALEETLAAMRMANRHALPGTAARYIGRNHDDPEEVEILLIWRSVVMPSSEERQASLTAFSEDLTGVLDWSTAVVKEGQVLLHA